MKRGMVSMIHLERWMNEELSKFLSAKIVRLAVVCD